MKKQNTYLVIGAVIILAIAGIYGYSTLDIIGGSGTIDDPYQVRTWTDLDSIRNDRTSYYILMNDLGPNDDGYNIFASSSANNGQGWEPIFGSWTYPFVGGLDGNGHVINGLHINRPVQTNVGLFSVTRGATIKNLGLTNVNIVGNNSVGALVGSAAPTSDGTQGTVIQECFSTGTVTSVSYSTSVRAGGLVGYHYDGGKIENSWSGANVINQYDGSRVGGFVGQAGGTSDGTASVLNSFSYGLVDTSLVTGINGGFIGVVSPSDQVVSSFWDIETSGKSESRGGTPATTQELKSISTFQNAGWDISTGTDTTWTIKSGSYPTLSIFEESYDPSDPDPQPTPGFGIFLFVLSLIGIAYIVKRKQ